MKRRKMKPLPLYKTPPKTFEQFKRRVISLLRRGWCKYKYSNVSTEHRFLGDALNTRATRVCLLGAAYRATNQHNYRNQFIKKLSRSIGKPFNELNDSAFSVSAVIAKVRSAK